MTTLERFTNFCSCEKKFCFYNAVLNACGGCSPNPSFWTAPPAMKRFLKIGEKDQVQLHHIPLIEAKLKICINVAGELQYSSSSKYPKNITLISKDGHFGYASKKQKIAKFWKQGLTFATYEIFDDFILTYDGNELTADYVLKESDLGNSDTIAYKQLNRSKWTDEMKDQLFLLKEANFTEKYAELLGDFMVSTHDTFVRNCDHLKSISDGAVDISAHGYNVKDTALYLFSKFMIPYQFETIDDVEFEWISGCKCYGLLYAKPAQFKGRCIDGNSWYSSIMVDQKLILPLGNPEYKTLDRLSDVISFGIYRAVIYGTDSRLFLHNPKNFYTYIDIKEALKRGYTVDLICDGAPNHLFYDSSSRETGHYLFRGFVDLLYPLKGKNPLVKQLLNMLWGALCQRVKLYHDDEVDFDSFDFLDICETDDATSFVEKAKKYVLPHARVGIFITAMGRAKLADAIADIKDEVYRVHTDGIYTSSAKEFEFSDELGGWKLEDEGEFVVENLRKPLKIR